MGSNQARRRELPAELIARAGRIVVDSIEQARVESGDLLMAWGEAPWRDARLQELQDVVTGSSHRARSVEEITLFKSNGLAIEDVAAAGYVYECGLEAGLGRSMAPLYS